MNMKNKIIIVFIVLILFSLFRYVKNTTDTSGENQVTDTESQQVSKEEIKDGEDKDIEREILDFVDVFGEHYQTEILEAVPKHNYDPKAFRRKGDKLYYETKDFTSRLGVDVSEHQGYIDWEKVKKAGYDFAFLRIGYRGYGHTGSMNPDIRFEENIKNAHAAGMDIGVYFFSQAINEQEAAQEAEFVIENLKGYELELPVVYDPESILDAEARTDNVSGEQFTKNTILFCDMIEEAGYKPMVYSNMLWEAFKFDMEKVSQYPFWYADYEKLPQTPYDFKYWQYSNSGTVDGIEGRVDLDIEMVKFVTALKE